MEFIEQKPNGALILLSRVELGTIGNALNEVCNGIVIEDWEFETRLGCSKAEAKALIDEVGRAYKKLPGS